jgi:excisionase family DNA binding protein
MATIVVTVPEPDPPPLLLPGEVAVLFRVDRRSVTRWAKEGKLHPIHTLGGHRRFYEAEVRALLRGEKWEPPGGWPASAAA